MKIAIFNEDRLGVVKGERIVDVGEEVNWDSADPVKSFEHLVSHFDDLKDLMEEKAENSEGIALLDVFLKSPVPSTRKIWAAPVNYLDHQKEMNEMFNNAPTTIEKLQLFLKSPESLSGPMDPILLPFADRRTDHEAELGYVVGRKAKNVKAEDAKDYIFGYFALIDISIRGGEERTWRKSFDTFTPIGPWIVTADEVSDPNDLAMKLWVNDELRQDGSTKNLIYDCYKCFESVSNNMTLLPGDIIATGTPEGVGPIEAGDKVKIQIEEIGEFTVDIKHADENK